MLVGLYVMPFAGIAFLWFIVSLRMWISDGLLPGPVRRVHRVAAHVDIGPRSARQ
jgi:hypothetical protein